VSLTVLYEKSVVYLLVVAAPVKRQE